MLRPDPLTDDVRHFLMDQVLAEVARLTAATYPDLPVTLAAGDRLGLFTAPGRPDSPDPGRGCARGAAPRSATAPGSSTARRSSSPSRRAATARHARAVGADLDRLAAEPG